MEDAVAEIIDDPGSDVPDALPSDHLQPEDALAFQKILDDSTTTKLIESDDSGNEGAGTSGVNTPSGVATPPRSSASSFVESSDKSKKCCSTKLRKKKANAEKDKDKNKDEQNNKPLLSELQTKMIASMNQIPGLKKQLVFIDPVINSHAVIVSRDVKRFKHHSIGEGVLRHLADHFVV